MYWTSDKITDTLRTTLEPDYRFWTLIVGYLEMIHALKRRVLSLVGDQLRDCWGKSYMYLLRSWLKWPELAEGREGGCSGSWNKTDAETSSLVRVPGWQSVTGHPSPPRAMLLPQSPRHWFRACFVVVGCVSCGYPAVNEAGAEKLFLTGALIMSVI